MLIYNQSKGIKRMKPVLLSQTKLFTLENFFRAAFSTRKRALRSILSLLAATILLLAGCSGSGNSADEQGIQIAVTVPPQAWLVRRIAGDLVKVQTMVGAGSDPHNYEPTPAQMVALADTDIYFTVGIEFEEAWMPKLSNSNRSMKVIPSDTGVQRIVSEHSHADEDGDEHAESEHAEEGTDPHIWYSPKRMAIMAENIGRELIKFDPQNKAVYEANLEKLLAEINQLESETANKLGSVQRKHFVILHPTLGYLAADYGLVQIAVESEGQEPGPEAMAHLIETAKNNGVKAVFYQKGNSIKIVESIAGQIGASQLTEIDSMPEDWPKGLMQAVDGLVEALN